MVDFTWLCRRGAVACVAIALVVAPAIAHDAATPTVTVLNGDADTEIDPANTYTHLLDFIADGSAANINGVQFTAAGRSGANYTSTNIPGEIAEVSFMGGGAGTGAPAGSGLHKLLTDFYYNSTANGAGQAETITLTGLIPSTSYRLRMFYRQWDANEANLRFTDITLNEETGNALIRINQDESENARMLVYDYVAGPSGTLNISFLEGGNTPSASWHQYGLSNEVLIPEPASVALVALGGVGLLSRRRGAGVTAF